MPEPDEYYAANTIPPLAWALELYLNKGARYKDSGPVEVIFPAGNHREKMQTKGKHEIVVWITKRQIWVRARCAYNKNCDFISERIDGSDREAVKSLPWDRIDSRQFFKAISRTVCAGASAF